MLACKFWYASVCGCVRLILYVYVRDRYTALVSAIPRLWCTLVYVYVNACSDVFALRDIVTVHFSVVSAIVLVRL